MCKVSAASSALAMCLVMGSGCDLSDNQKPIQPEAKEMNESIGPASVKRLSIDQVLSLKVPSDWSEFVPPDDLVFIAMAPERQGRDLDPQVQVIRTHVADETDSIGYLVVSHVSMEANTAGYQRLSSGSRPTDGTDIAWLRYPLKIEGRSATSIDFFVVIGDVGYIVRCRSLTRDAEEFGEAFRAVGNSISIKKGQKKETATKFDKDGGDLGSGQLK